MKKTAILRVILRVIIGIIIAEFGCWLIYAWWTAAGHSVISAFLPKPEYLIRCWIRDHQDGFLSEVALFGVTGIGIILILLGLYITCETLIKEKIRERNEY
ncbi:hypothetical protein IKE82_01680 [Candidatus Saccharibacteria bacterium]|nr:hypothetical protein [Candidatus Saccharibacteria bacterium]